METQHPNNVVDLMLFQLYCHVASNPNGNAASRRLSTRPDDLTQVLVLPTTYYCYLLYLLPTTYLLCTTYLFCTTYYLLPTIT